MQGSNMMPLRVTRIVEYIAAALAAVLWLIASLIGKLEFGTTLWFGAVMSGVALVTATLIRWGGGRISLRIGACALISGALLSAYAGLQIEPGDTPTQPIELLLLLALAGSVVTWIRLLRAEKQRRSS